MNILCNCRRASFANSIHKLFSEAVNLFKKLAVRITLYHPSSSAAAAAAEHAVITPHPRPVAPAASARKLIIIPVDNIRVG